MYTYIYIYIYIYIMFTCRQRSSVPGALRRADRAAAIGHNQPSRQNDATCMVFARTCAHFRV